MKEICTANVTSTPIDRDGMSGQSVAIACETCPFHTSFNVLGFSKDAEKDVTTTRTEDHLRKNCKKIETTNGDSTKKVKIKIPTIQYSE